MPAPTARRYPRASTDVQGLEQQVTAALATIRGELGELVDDSPIDQAVCTVEMYVAVSMRVLRKTNPSKVRSEARNVEIQARMDGKPESRAPALAGPGERFNGEGERNPGAC